MSKKQYNVRTAAVAATERRARRRGASVVTAGSGSSYNEVYGDIAGKLDRELFDSMFERVSEGVDAEGVERWYIRAKSHLVSVGDVTAYGNGGPGGGGSTGGGVTELRSLDDVILTDPKAGQILKYDGRHWVNKTIDAGLNETALATYLQANRYAKLSDIPSLADYATQSWVEGKSYATQSWVEDKGYATEAWVIAQHYLTEHQDISHLLTRAEFDSMFERVDTDGGGWYILAKSHLASVGDVTAYGTGGLGSTLGGIGDVQLGSLAAGDVLKWDGQHWVNGPAPAGGIDEEQLAAYLTANNYITQADLGNYVTALGTSDGYLTWTKDGVTNNITVPFATSTDFLNGVIPTVITDAPGDYKARLYTNIHSGKAGLFPVVNNSNAILTISRHGGNYYSQLGFSSDANMYYRSFNGVALNTTTAWNLVLTSGNYTSTLDSRYANKAGDTMTGDYVFNGGEAHFVVKGLTYTDPLPQVACAIKAAGKIAVTDYIKASHFVAGTTTLCANLNADLLDGLHGGDYVGYRGLISSIGVLPATAGMYQIATAGWSGGVVVFHCAGSNSGLAFYRPGGSNSMPQILCALDRTNNWDNFGSIVTSRFGNAPSATKLQTARTLRTTSYNGYRASDGVSFDGTGDVTLKLPNSICASDWFRSYGSSGWYNQDYAGGIYMTDSTWVRIYNNKGFYSGTGEIRSDSRFNRMGYHGDMWNKGQGAYNVAIYNNANQTPLLLAYRGSAGLEATGADRLFAIELLNNGAELKFGFGGTTRFTFYSGGHLVASGDVTAYSDARLKSDVQTLR
ncbi:shufflon system plasmid conjugative transfer pilus tip adhesin PilV, partial [Paramuribaculum intestinale]|uniref:shufflon system plasmid conjugative transfer pilus tip adhesin PilV n=1 Tax=Paramuribaculum intestinale TaxID=2094151 RepID=UPI0032B149F7